MNACKKELDAQVIDDFPSPTFLRMYLIGYLIHPPASLNELLCKVKSAGQVR